MIEIALIVAGLVSIAACGAFVAAEFALVTVDRASVERAAESGDLQAVGTSAPAVQRQISLKRAG